MSAETRDLLKNWHERSSKSEQGHYQSATSCRAFNYILGIPLVIITTIIATEFFANIKDVANGGSPFQINRDIETATEHTDNKVNERSNSTDKPSSPEKTQTQVNVYHFEWNHMYSLYMLIAYFTVTAPILAGLQTFLRFPERANQHRQAAVKYGLLKRDIETYIAFTPKDEADIEEKIKEFKLKEEGILNESPSIGTLSLKYARRQHEKKENRKKI